MNEGKPRNTGNFMIRFFHFLMAFVYVVIGCALIMNVFSLAPLGLPIIVQQILGVLVILYGGFRMYRAIKSDNIGIK